MYRFKFIAHNSIDFGIKSIFQQSYYKSQNNQKAFSRFYIDKFFSIKAPIDFRNYFQTNFFLKKLKKLVLLEIMYGKLLYFYSIEDIYKIQIYLHNCIYTYYNTEN